MKKYIISAIAMLYLFGSVYAIGATNNAERYKIYDVVCKTDIDSLCDRINYLLNKGWKCQGGVEAMPRSSYLCQAMVFE